MPGEVAEEERLAVSDWSGDGYGEAGALLEVEVGVDLLREDGEELVFFFGGGETDVLGQSAVSSKEAD